MKQNHVCKPTGIVIKAKNAANSLPSLPLSAILWVMVATFVTAIPANANTISCGPLNCGQPVAGTISAAWQTNAYTFTSASNQAVQLAIVNTSGTLSVSWNLFNSAGNLIASGQQVTVGMINLQKSGTYTILVQDSEGTNTGGYSVCFSFATGVCGAAISCGRTISRDITAPAQIDAYTFTGASNQAVAITAANTSAALLAYAWLYDPTGFPIATATQGTLSQRLTKNGLYTILVNDVYGSNTGNYSVGLNFAPGSCGTPISCGQTISNAISAPGQIDAYIFTGTANEAVQVIGVGTSGNLTAQAKLYSPNGTQIWPGAFQSGYASFVLSTNGTYTILVYDNQGTNTGNYEVGLSLTAGGSGTSLSCGEGVSNAITAVAQVDAYTFSATAGEAVIVTGVHTSGNLTAVADLYDPSGNYLGRTYEGSMSSSIPLPKNGTYTILVQDAFCTNTGSYAVGFSFATGECGTPISCGQTFSNQISAAAQIDTYTFNATSNEAVVFSGKGTSGSLQLETDLYDPFGNNIGSGRLPTNGLYTILVRASDGTNTGSYAVGVGFATGRCGTPIACGQTISNAISSSAEFQAYTFEATNDEAVVLTAITSSGTLNADAFLYDPAGNYVGTSWVAGNKSYPLSATGLYTILVHDMMYQDTGSYELNLRFSTGRCGTPIECGQPLTGTISTVAQNDAYTFTGTTNDAVVLTVMTSSGNMAAYADLFGPSGRLITNDYQCLSGNKSFPLPSNGLYTILVHDLTDSGIGTYAVCLNFVTGGEDGCGTPIVCGQTISNTFSSAAQTAAYTFSAAAGEPVVITAMGCSGILDAKADLYEPSGSLIAGNWTGVGAYGTTRSFLLPTNGVYTILAHGSDYGDTGNYWISLLNSTPSFGAPLAHSTGTSQLQLNGLAGLNYTLYSTTNPAAPMSNWVVVLTTNLSGGSAVLQDTNATNSHLFYILKVSP